MIGDKLDNLAALDYPPGLIRILVVDGGSSDETREIVKRRAARDARIALIVSGVSDKTAQLNMALRLARASWILVTDADARMEPDTLSRLVGTVSETPAYGVAGTSIDRPGAHALDRCHTTITNVVREREAARGCASMVLAPCYLFARNLIDSFPADVVADDVHVALAAMTSGRRVAFIRAGVVELRSASHFVDVCGHKLRKTDALLREIFRFLPRAMEMPPPVRLIFLWRAGQLVLSPVLALMTAVLLVQSLSAFALLPVLVLAGAAVILRWTTLLAPFVVMMMSGILLGATIAYPFSRQTAAFPKVGERPEVVE